MSFTDGRFVTNDSGERQTFSTGMQRDSAAKELRPDLLPVSMLRRWRESGIIVGDSGPNTLKTRAFESFLRWFGGDSSTGYYDAAAEVFSLIEAHEQIFERAPMLVRWAELMGRGAIKYGERNWEKARTEEELARFKASAFRHFVQWYFGMNKEEDHAAAVFFNIAGAEYVKDRLYARGQIIDIKIDVKVPGTVKPFETAVSLSKELEAKLEDAAAKIVPSWEPTQGDVVRVVGNVSMKGKEATIEGPCCFSNANENEKVSACGWWRVRTAEGPYVLQREDFELVSGAT